MTDPDRDIGRDDADRALDAALAALRDRGPRPDAALLGRVLADAAAEQPRRGPAARWLARRWPSAAPAGLLGGGLGAALLAGVWIGAAPPEPLLALEEALLGPLVLIDLADPADDFPPL